MNKRNKTMVSIIAVILAILMVFGLVVSIIPYVLAERHTSEEAAEATVYEVLERTELSA